jgi:hypothetical protein
MPRVIRSFRKDDEGYSNDIILPDIDVNSLRAHFEIKDCNNPLYDCVKLNPEDVDFFCAYTSYVFDFKKFNYFLEYDK